MICSTPSMSKKELFSLEAANALIPRIRNICERQFERRTDIERALKNLGEQSGERSAEKSGLVAEIVTISPGDKKEVRDVKRLLVALIERYRAGWREVEDLGVVVKDPRVGLMDFNGEVNGRAIYFCWRYGEGEIAHYHGLNEGFAGRKAIDRSDKQRLLN